MHTNGTAFCFPFFFLPLPNIKSFRMKIPNWGGKLQSEERSLFLSSSISFSRIFSPSPWKVRWRIRPLKRAKVNVQEETAKSSMRKKCIENGNETKILIMNIHRELVEATITVYMLTDGIKTMVQTRTQLSTLPMANRQNKRLPLVNVYSRAVFRKWFCH